MRTNFQMGIRTAHQDECCCLKPICGFAKYRRVFRWSALILASKDKGHGVLNWVNKNVKRETIFETLKKISISYSKFGLLYPETSDTLYKLFVLISKGNSFTRQPSIHFKSLAFILVDSGVSSDREMSSRSTILEYVFSQDYKWLVKEQCDRRKLLSIICYLFSHDNTVNEVSSYAESNRCLNLVNSVLCKLDFADEDTHCKVVIELICFLILKGINVNATTRYSSNIMHLLFWAYRPCLSQLIIKIARLLIELGINVKHVVPHGNLSVLNILCFYYKGYDAKFVELVDLLIKAGVDVDNMTTFRLDAMLQIIVVSRYPNKDPYFLPVISLILEQVTNVGSINRALYAICCKENEDLAQILVMVRLLIESGADVFFSYNFNGDQPEDTPLKVLLVANLEKKFYNANECSNYRMTASNANCWLQIFQLFYKNRTHVNWYHVTSVLAELAIVCRYYYGDNLLDIVGVVFKYVTAHYPKYFTPVIMQCAFIHILENTFHKDIRLQMYQIFSLCINVEQPQLPVCVYQLIDASENRSSRNKRKHAIDVIYDIQIGKRRKLC